MSFLGKRNVCIASGFEGQVTFKGEPASGARIIRKIHWKKENGVVETVKADKDGRFTFSSQWDTDGEEPALNLSIRQDIFVEYNGKENKILGTAKSNGKEHSEFDGKIKNFRCELTDRKVRRVEREVGFTATTCRWDCVE